MYYRNIFLFLMVTVIALFNSMIANATSVVWKLPSSKPPYYAMEWSLTVLKLPLTRSYYYWAQQDDFVGGGTFYFGLQPYGGTPNRKVALFSFFGNGATTKSGNCNPGADGGPGMSCMISYDWKMGVTYRFKIELTDFDSTNKKYTWTGTVTDTSTGIAREIGNWTIPGQSNPDLGLIAGVGVSFVEYYIQPAGGCAAQPYAQVKMSVPVVYQAGGPLYADVDSTSITSQCAAYDKISYDSTGAIIDTGAVH